MKKAIADKLEEMAKYKLKQLEGCFPTLHQERDIETLLKASALLRKKDDQRLALYNQLALSPKRKGEVMKPIDILTKGKHSANIKNCICNGCGKPVKAEDFRDKLSVKEYGISGFCQKCQDEVFGK